jgi:hypothetical protein
MFCTGFGRLVLSFNVDDNFNIYEGYIWNREIREYIDNGRNMYLREFKIYSDPFDEGKNFAMN